MSELRKTVAELKEFLRGTEGATIPARLMDPVASALNSEYFKKLTIAAGTFFYFPFSTHEDIAQEALSDFCKAVASGKGDARSVLLGGREWPFLKTILRNKSIDQLRRTKQKQKPQQVPLYEQDIPSAKKDNSLLNNESGAFLVAALNTLKWSERRVLRVTFGWDVNFNRLHGLDGTKKQIADYLQLTTRRCTELRKSGIESLKAKAAVFQKYGKFDAAKALQSLAEGQPTRDGFTSPYFHDPLAARYALQIVESAHELGEAHTRDILRAVEQADFIGDPERSQKFLKRLVDTHLVDAGLGERFDILTTTAILLDHMAARAERSDDWATAKKLLKGGLRALDSIFTEEFDSTNLPKEFARRYTRSLLQKGILLRRLHEINHHGQSKSESNELQQARTNFREVVHRAERGDHRISASHQLAVCELLAGDLDKAEAMFKSCLEDWESLAFDHPEDALEFYFRSAYEHRRLANVAACRMAAACDDADVQRRYEEAIDQLDLSESISRRCGNLRYTAELEHERLLLEEQFPVCA